MSSRKCNRQQRKKEKKENGCRTVVVAFRIDLSVRQRERQAKASYIPSPTVVKSSILHPFHQASSKSSFLLLRVSPFGNSNQSWQENKDLLLSTRNKTCFFQGGVESLDSGATRIVGQAKMRSVAACCWRKGKTIREGEKSCGGRFSLWLLPLSSPA